MSVRVRHPRALDAVDGHPPAAVTLGRHTYGLDSDHATEMPTAAAERLAANYDVSLAAIRVDDDGDGCPYCEDYDGDHVAQHVAQAHPDAE